MAAVDADRGREPLVDKQLDWITVGVFLREPLDPQYRMLPKELLHFVRPVR